jgi:hypothetical protein
MDHDIIDFTNHTLISGLDYMDRHIIAILVISVRPEGGQVPCLIRPLTQQRSRLSGC